MRSASCVLAALLIAACSAQTPVVSDDAAAPVDASEAAANDSSTSDSSTADADAADAGPSDAALEAEAGMPTTTCVDQTLVNGSGNHVGCQANQSSVIPGGKFAVGDYSNTGLYGLPYCPIAYAIGSAHVYVENGVTFFRYFVTRKTNINDPGTTTMGTYWVKSNDGTGPLEIVEVCNLTNKGKARAGTLFVTGNDFIMTFSDGQEKWTKF